MRAQFQFMGWPKTYRNRINNNVFWSKEARINRNEIQFEINMNIEIEFGHSHCVDLSAHIMRNASDSFQFRHHTNEIVKNVCLFKLEIKTSIGCLTKKKNHH